MKSYLSLKYLKNITKAYLIPKKGDIAFCEKEQAKYGYNGKDWVPLTEMGDQEISTGLTAFEANKQIISQLPPITDKELNELKDCINNYDKAIFNTYYMLLCKEFSYYTVLVMNGIDEFDYRTLGDGVLDLLSALGEIRTYNDNCSDIEIWITIDEETMCFHLFGYDGGVVTYASR